MYTEGAVVKAGQVLFRMDQKPFQAQVDGQAAALQRNQAALEVATANLKRTKPLAEQNALSQKDLDDAQGQYEQAQAAVAQGKAQLEEAKLNLSYTTITSPVDGVSSFAAVADGTYVNPQNSQLTTVSVLTPMWINFSVSENEMQRIRNQVQQGQIRLPEGNQFVVEIELVDGTLFPVQGQDHVRGPVVQLADGNVPDPRVGRQSRKACCVPTSTCARGSSGAIRPNAILVPQRAVQQGAKGHFVWVVNKDQKAELRPVVVGDWYGESWFIAQGLAAGDRVVVDGALRLAPDAPVKATAYTPKPESPEAAAPTRPPGATLVVNFASGKATLDAEATRLLEGFAPSMKAGANPIDVTGFADRTGNPAANVELAKRRAAAVRDALVAEGIPADRVRLSSRRT